MFVDGKVNFSKAELQKPSPFSAKSKELINFTDEIHNI